MSTRSVVARLRETAKDRYKAVSEINPTTGNRENTVLDTETGKSVGGPYYTYEQATKRAAQLNSAKKLETATEREFRLRL